MEGVHHQKVSNFDQFSVTGDSELYVVGIAKRNKGTFRIRAWISHNEPPAETPEPLVSIDVQFEEVEESRPDPSLTWNNQEMAAPPNDLSEIIQTVGANTAEQENDSLTTRGDS